jgi:ATP-dependent protease ClpP protease subunit
MPKPLLLYMPIYDFVAESFVNQMNDIPIDEDIDIWVNSPGGRVFAGWSIIGPMQKRKGKINMSIYGNASSMAVYLPLFSTYAEALEVTQFVLHRADGYVETPEDQTFLDSINKDLRKQMEKRLNMEAFTRITGKTMDEMFDPKTRINVQINAKEAKEIGLINKIIKLDSKQIESMSKHFVAFADFSEPTQEPTQRSEQVKPNENSDKPKTVKNMTLAELQAQHPELFSAIQTNAIKAERDRVGSYLAFVDIDKENVIKAIKEGTDFSSAVMAEMTVKLTAHHAKANIEDDGKDTPKPNTPKVDPKSPEAQAIEAEVKQVEDGSKNFVKNYKF